MNNCSIAPLNFFYRYAVSIEELSIWGEYGTNGKIRAIKGKYDQIRVINAA